MRRHGPVIAHCTDLEDFAFIVSCANTSAVFQPKILVVSCILAIFFTYRDNSAKPNISQNFFPAIQNFKKIRLGVYSTLLTALCHQH